MNYCNYRCYACILEKVEQKDEEKTRGGLHARLNHEAEKIRKWKVQTELELKAKVMSLFHKEPDICYIFASELVNSECISQDVSQHHCISNLFAGSKTARSRTNCKKSQKVIFGITGTCFGLLGQYDIAD